jgi:hypothetical protein
MASSREFLQATVFIKFSICITSDGVFPSRNVNVLLILQKSLCEMVLSSKRKVDTSSKVFQEKWTNDFFTSKRQPCMSDMQEISSGHERRTREKTMLNQVFSI